jgi:hypothetical protein
VTAIQGGAPGEAVNLEETPGQGHARRVETDVSVAAARGLTRRDLVLLAALIAVAVVIPLALFIATGAIDIAHNDDFSYRRAALGLYSNGEIQLTGWGVMTLVGQLLFVQPFLWVSAGASASLGVSTAVLAVVTIAAGFVLARQLLPLGLATLAVLELVVFPGFLINTTSFMTDIPTLAGELLCLLFGVLALQNPRRRFWYLAAALIAGCFAFSVRQTAIAAPVAVVVSVVIADPARWKRYAAAAAGAIAVCAAIFVITTNLPGQGSERFEPLSSAHVKGAMDLAATLALVLLPALLVAISSWGRLWRIRYALAGGALAALIYREPLRQLVTTQVVPNVIVGNLFEQSGALGQAVLAGDRPVLFEQQAWSLISIAALIAVVTAGAVLGAAVGYAIRGGPTAAGRRIIAFGGSPAGMLAIFATIYGAGITVVSLVGITFDRYAWPLVIPLSVLLLIRPPSDQRTHRSVVISAGFLLTCLGFISLAVMLNSIAYDTARWEAGQVSVRRGLPPDAIDAGLEWMGLNVPGPALLYPLPVRGEVWYVGSFPRFRGCAFVASSPVSVPGFVLDSVNWDAYRLLLVAGPAEPLYTYRSRNKPGC